MPGLTRRRYTNIIALAGCSLLLLAFFILSYTAVLTKSATYDEPMHALGAWIHLHMGDFRINFEDPPLWQYWAALPNGKNAIKVNLQDDWWKAMPDSIYAEWPFTIATLYRTPGNDGAAFVNHSRFMMVLLGLALGVVISFWSWKLAGPIAALIAAALFCLDPNMIGHAALVKNDVPMSLTMLAAFLACWYVGKRVTIWNALALAVIVGIAVNVKFSTLLLAPMLVVVFVIRALLPIPWPVLKRTYKTISMKLLTAAAICVTTAVVSYILIWASYGFRYDPSPDSSVALNSSRYKFESAQYHYQATFPPPVATPFDPTEPPQQLLNDLQSEIDSIKLANDDLISSIRTSPGSTMLRASLEDMVRQNATAIDDAARKLASARALVGNIDAVIPEKFNQVCRDLHDLTMALQSREYGTRMASSFATTGDEAPDGFIAFLNIFFDHRLLPSAWLNGVLFVHARSAVRGSFLLGQISPTGWWYYFPLAMLFKTPVATLLTLFAALGLGIWALVRRAAGWRGYVWTLTCLFIPVAIYMISAMGSNLNIGLRHVLPVYPFMYIVTAVLIVLAMRRWGQPILVATAVLALMLAAETLKSWPNYVDYFNFAVADYKINLLADSNLDWGQDLPALAEWQKAHPDVPLAFGPIDQDGGSYFGTVDPAFYGIRSDPLPGGPPPPELAKTHILGVSATLLQGVYGKQYKNYRDYQPVQILNGTIYLYDLRSAR